MALINHAKKEINAKIVYYGPAGNGKSDALNYIYSRIKPSLRGELKSAPAGTDNLMFFDFSPFEAPLLNGYRVRLHVYTLTGTVSNPGTWKMTLKGVDGIIIMLTPTIGQLADARDSVLQLRDFLSAYGVGLHETPAVLQFNSSAPGNQTDAVAEIAAALDLSTLAIFQSDATSGDGLLEALTALSRQILDRITLGIEPSTAETFPSAPSSESENEYEEPYHQTVSADPTEMPYARKVPHVALVSREVVSEDGSLRIPLEISLGGSLRKLVVTVSVQLE